MLTRNQKLTTQDVRRILRTVELRDQLRREISDAYSERSLARRFHVGKSTIWRIMHGRYREDRAGRTARIASAVRDAIALREILRAHIDLHMTNKALAERLGTHVQTMNNVTRYAWYRHVR